MTAMRKRTILRSSLAVLLGVVAIVAGLRYWHRTPAAPTGIRALRVPDGFTVQQVAGSDLLSYPMMGTLDDRGRLFICESSGNTLNNTQMAAHPDYKIRLL